MDSIIGILITVFIVGFVLAALYFILRFIYLLLVKYLHVYKWIALIYVICIVPLLLFNIFSKFKFGCGANYKKIRISTDHSMARFIKSKMASNIPDTMEVGTLNRASARIVQNINDSILFKNIPDSEYRKFAIDTFRISSRVKVSLIDPSGGENFTIHPLSSEEQVVDKTNVRIWRWSIMPIKGGNNQELDLRVSTMVNDDFGPAFEDIPVLEKRIFVKSTVVKSVSQFLEDNWQWFTGAIFLPLLLWGRVLFLKWKGKKKNKPIPVKGFLNKDKS